MLGILLLLSAKHSETDAVASIVQLIIQQLPMCCLPAGGNLALCCSLIFKEGLKTLEKSCWQKTTFLVPFCRLC